MPNYVYDKKRLFYSYGALNSFEFYNNKEIKLIDKKVSNSDNIKAVCYSEKLKPEILKFHQKFFFLVFAK